MNEANTENTTRGFVAKRSIEAISPYVAGKPIEETAREYGLDVNTIVKLASNENPLGMPESAVKAALAAASGANRYPDGNARMFRAAVARHHGVTSDWVIAGNGSDEILSLAARLVLTPGTRCVYSQYSFSVYELSAEENGAECVEVPAKDFAVDLEAMLAAIDEKTRLVFITNPNNPTGYALTKEQVESFMDRVPETCVVVFDEAYVDFLPAELQFDSIELVRRHPNMMVTRTFSKAYGLAGLRAGYGIAQPAMIEMMNRIRPPFNMNLIAQAAACACLEDKEFLARVTRVNREGLEALEAFFDERGVHYLKSCANFILVQTGPKTAELYTELLKRGVIVRPVKSYGLADWMRISVGTAEELKRFFAAYDESAAVLAAK